DVDIMDSNQTPGLRFPSGPGPTLGDVENCLTAITASADVVAACLACAWLPGQVGRPPARGAIARLAGARGTRLSYGSCGGRNRMTPRPVEGGAGRPGQPGQPDHHPHGGHW